MMNKKVVRVALAVVLLFAASGAFMAFFAVPAYGGENGSRIRITSREDAMRVRREAFRAFGFFPKEDIPKLMSATERPGEPAIVAAGTSFVAVIFEEGASVWRKNSAAFGGKPFIRAEKWSIPWKGDVLEVIRSEEGYFVWGIRWSDHSDEKDVARLPSGAGRIRSIST